MASMPDLTPLVIFLLLGMKRFTFPKPEHLCLQRDIETLFSAGSHAATVYPLRVVYRPVAHSGGPAVTVLISVGKRRLHHAVDRNRAKRQIREAYRHHKHVLIDALPEGVGLHVAFLWLADSPRTTGAVVHSMQHLLQRLADAAPTLNAPTPCDA